MILQLIGVLLAVIGFFTHLSWLFIIGGFLLLFLDVSGFLSGMLNPLFPLFLYIGGWIIVGNWTGILWGAVLGNFLEIALIILGGTGFAVFEGLRQLLKPRSKKPILSEEFIGRKEGKGLLKSARGEATQNWRKFLQKEREIRETASRHSKQIGWYKEATDHFLCVKCFQEAKNLSREDYKPVKEDSLEEDIYICDKCGRVFD